MVQKLNKLETRFCDISNASPANGQATRGVWFTVQKL